MSNQFKLKPIISNLGNELHIDTSDDNDSECSDQPIHEIIMDLNESINMMNLEEIPKPEPIFRLSTLNKIIEPIINKIEKTAEKISEEKTQESVFTYFKNLQTLENLNEIKNEDHSEENFTPSFMQEPLRLNHF